MASENSVNYQSDTAIVPSVHFNRKSQLCQWTAGIIASLGIWTMGSSLGWSATAVPQLLSGSDIEGLTKTEISWAASIVMLTSLPGSFLGGYLADLLGRKKFLIYITAPFLAGWGILAGAQSAWMLIAGRALLGLTGTAVFVAACVFCAEFADDHMRSKLASWNVVALCLGILYAFIIGAVVNWRENTIICGATQILAFIGLLFVPESPRYLVSRGNVKQASVALQWFRGATTEMDVQEELAKLMRDVSDANLSQDSNREATTREKLFAASTIKPVLICVASAALAQLSGTTAVTFYTVDIFVAAGSDIQPHIATILVGATQAAATAFAGVLITKFGRRGLFIFSELGMCLSLGVLGGFYYFKENHPEEITDLGWLPLASLVGFTITYCSGAGTLTWVLVADLCPPHVKGVTSAVATATMSGLGFIVALLFPRMLESVGGYGAFWTFSVINAVGGLFMAGVLPETKDKTMDEILAMFRDKSRGRRQEDGEQP